MATYMDIVIADTVSSRRIDTVLDGMEGAAHISTVDGQHLLRLDGDDRTIDAVLLLHELRPSVALVTRPYHHNTRAAVWTYENDWRGGTRRLAKATVDTIAEAQTITFRGLTITTSTVNEPPSVVLTS